ECLALLDLELSSEDQMRRIGCDIAELPGIPECERLLRSVVEIALNRARQREAGREHLSGLAGGDDRARGGGGAHRRGRYDYLEVRMRLHQIDRDVIALGVVVASELRVDHLEFLVFRIRLGELRHDLYMRHMVG